MSIDESRINTETIISQFRVKHKIETLYIHATGTYQASIKGRGSARDKSRSGAIRKLGWDLRLEGYARL